MREGDDPSAGARSAECMGRAEWLAVVMREANALCDGTAAGPGGAEKLERLAAEAAARVVAAAADPVDFVRHSALHEPKGELWREARTWSDALVAVACACLEHDITEHAGRIASGAVPHVDPGRIV